MFPKRPHSLASLRGGDMDLKHRTALPSRVKRSRVVGWSVASLWVSALFGLRPPTALEAQSWPASAGSACRTTDPPPERVVDGSTLDLLTLRPVGGVSVTLRSTVGRQVQILGETTSGAEGTYIFCNVPPLSGLNVTGELMGSSSRSVPVADDPSLTVPPIYIRWSEPADIAGQVLDGVTGEPVDGVLIELEGRPVRAVTDEEGRFRILGQGAGRFILRSSHLGYATRTDSVDVASRDRLDFEIYLFEDAVELAPVVVRVRSDVDEQRRSAATRIDALSRVQIDSLLPQVTDMISLLRAGHFPGTEFRRMGTSLCIDISSGGVVCNEALVFVNGIRLVDAFELLSIPPETVASIQVLDPMEAKIRFGYPGRYGVILITLR